MRAARRRGRAGSDERRVLLDRAVAIGAIELDGRARLAIQLAVAVAVLLEMAIDALHALLGVNVLQMDGLPEFIRIVGGNDFAVGIEQIALTVTLVDGAENPAVAVKVGELRLLELLIEFRAADLREKFRIRPEATHRGRLRIRLCRLVALLFGGMPLLSRIHILAVRFVVPPGVAEIGGLHVGSGMDVANHAGARWNRPRERVPNRMAGFVFRNGWVRC